MTVTASALRHLPVPDTEPPLEPVPEPDPPWRRAVRRPPAGVQGVLTLVVGDADESDEDVGFGPRPTATSDLPDPERWARQMVQVIAEVLSGQRSSTQLLRWTVPEVYEAIRSRTTAPNRPGTAPYRRPRVGTVRVCEPADGVAEVAAVVHGPQRTRAVALRMEGMDGRWRVTVFRAG
jgi:Family of unknown function (DUF6459)